MRTITATELARNLREILDRLSREGEDVVVERNNREVARITPVPARQTALEALGDLYRTLAEDAAAGWAEEARRAFDERTAADEVRDPWES